MALIQAVAIVALSGQLEVIVTRCFLQFEYITTMLCEGRTDAIADVQFAHFKHSPFLSRPLEKDFIQLFLRCWRAGGNILVRAR